MRNDAHDELDNIPSLTAGRDRDPYPAPELEPIGKSTSQAADDARPRQKRRAASTAPLWFLILVLFGLLIALGWWGLQQVSRLEAQLVATQESFARISEDATGRLQDISGKIVATESSVTTEGEALKLRIKQLEKQALDLAEQQRAITTQQQSLTGKQGNQDKRLDEQGGQIERIATDVREHQSAAATLADTVKKVASDQAALTSSMSALKGSVDELGKLSGRIDGLSKDVAALKQRGDASQAISRLEQDVLILRSELDNRPAATPGVVTSEFDAFRAQMTRNINTLQGQIANLQQQIDQR
ncbi:MAG: ATPase [Pseudomonas sp.]|jgi:DNA repair exonuclease SbcCD ATPase subunit|uniref:ATPase n=1 Tax=Stutzerimonas stutzeri TaxID=316 RepID=A0A5S5B6R5_STUST|nr:MULTISPECIES: ATPase [Pseudomonadaceae]MAX91606.1 ATPase [Pseudomonas sp.]MBU0813125.1 ATPase [Gammaproteobacteria bacterium]MBK3848028.1 ATPase [Stutzerimonas xanthomarina]MBK60444.1 ATPase [Pseudomonas sp.]MBU0853023.1 ATPase [Gammaproteobacteria bacterium]|tara:strand:- start:20821 stop:21723 length:903 start_codon:yes stop_codon:yes gene_type:complete